MSPTLAIIFLLLCPFSVTSESSSKSKSEEKFLTPAKYHNSNELKTLFKNLEKQHPRQAKLFTIGQSVRNRELVVLQLNGQVRDVPPLTPKFKYVANINGDETVGRELIIYLAQYLLENYGKIQRITDIIDRTNIFLLPALNPDGFENAKVGLCRSPKGRNNKNGINLSQDFPRARSGKQTKNTSQPETQAMVDWMTNTHFVLSGALRGGSLGTAYPKLNDGGKGNLDQVLFKHLSEIYFPKRVECEYPSQVFGPEDLKEPDYESILDEQDDKGSSGKGRSSVQYAYYVHEHVYGDYVHQHATIKPPKKGTGKPVHGNNQQAQGGHYHVAYEEGHNHQGGHQHHHEGGHYSGHGTGHQHYYEAGHQHGSYHGGQHVGNNHGWHYGGHPGGAHGSWQIIHQNQKIKTSDEENEDGMHNFNYFGSNCIELTIMLSCCHSPPANMLKDLWYRNKDSLINFIDASHWGIKGTITTEEHIPVSDALVAVNGDYKQAVKTTSEGEYWRLLPPGHYNVSVRSEQFQDTIPETIIVTGGETIIKNFQLTLYKKNIYRAKKGRNPLKEKFNNQEGDDYPNRSLEMKSSSALLCMYFAVYIFVTCMYY